jgi:hypothetical protein
MYIDKFTDSCFHYFLCIFDIGVYNVIKFLIIFVYVYTPTTTVEKRKCTQSMHTVDKQSPNISTTININFNVLFKTPYTGRCNKTLTILGASSCPSIHESDSNTQPILQGRC